MFNISNSKSVPDNPNQESQAHQGLSIPEEERFFLDHLVKHGGLMSVY